MENSESNVVNDDPDYTFEIINIPQNFIQVSLEHTSESWEVKPLIKAPLCIKNHQRYAYRCDWIYSLFLMFFHAFYSNNLDDLRIN